MAIDASVGGAASDSFVDVADADAYMLTRLHTAEWDDSTNTDTQKEKALKWATRLLDIKNWYGVAYATTQALRWPRSGVVDLEGNIIETDIVPQWLKDATAELALSLIKGDRTADSDTLGFSKIKVDVIELEIDKHDRAAVIPDAVYSLISPYLANTGVKLSRV